MTFSAKFNLLIAALVAYALTSAFNGTAMLSMYQILNNKELGLTMVVVFLIAAIVLYSLEQYKDQRTRIRASMTLRRQPKLKAHMQAGLKGGSFAYLAEQQPYGAPGEDASWLPAMAVVYIIDLDEVGHCVCVPYFNDKDLQRPMLAITVAPDKLYKHVPRHMIPELI